MFNEATRSWNLDVAEVVPTEFGGKNKWWAYSNVNTDDKFTGQIRGDGFVLRCIAIGLFGRNNSTDRWMSRLIHVSPGMVELGLINTLSRQSELKNLCREFPIYKDMRAGIIGGLGEEELADRVTFQLRRTQFSEVVEVGPKSNDRGHLGMSVFLDGIAGQLEYKYIK